jgi:Ni,Fe-hydrogenase maturation factor
LGAKIDRVLLVGCEPQALDSEDMQMEMTEPVKRAVREAVSMIETMVTQVREQGFVQLDWQPS